jgi:hypothetical protein
MKIRCDNREAILTVELEFIKKQKESKQWLQTMEMIEKTGKATHHQKEEQTDQNL